MLKKIFILNFVLLIFTGIGYCYSEDELNRLEFLKFGQVYEQDSLGERLNRLEAYCFGMSQSGDINTRINNLKQLSNSTPIMAYPYDNKYPAKKKNKIKTILDTASEFFGAGSLTGFTPSFTGSGYSDNMYQNEFNNFFNNQNSYCPYQNQYKDYNNNLSPDIDKNLFSEYSQYMHNFPIGRHYNESFYTPPNITTGTGVHIIKD